MLSRSSCERSPALPSHSAPRTLPPSSTTISTPPLRCDVHCNWHLIAALPSKRCPGAPCQIGSAQGAPRVSERAKGTADALLLPLLPPFLPPSLPPSLPPAPVLSASVAGSVGRGARAAGLTDRLLRPGPLGPRARLRPLHLRLHRPVSLLSLFSLSVWSCVLPCLLCSVSWCVLVWCGVVWVCGAWCVF